ncbi:hypothetical protein [Oceanobacillus rekensis]|uniref:hypothetical protein n=1 Tax=Oceanobacillus rekensis TaxID=937927 RepID=UPI000B42F04A|nr:hypothetical protein [Oceanobacillus rekensis]
MEEKERKLKMGWFGWTMVSVVTVIIIGSGIFYFTVLNGDDADATDQSDLTDGGKDEIEKVRSTVGQENLEAAQFVAMMHGFYNETAGYGGINNLNWEEQKENSHQVIRTIEELKPDISDESLIIDLESIQTLAQNTLDEMNSSDVRNLHRYFHDLDIALNDYDTYDKIWKVTETLKNIE